MKNLLIIGLMLAVTACVDDVPAYSQEDIDLCESTGGEIIFTPGGMACKYEFVEEICLIGSCPAVPVELKFDVEICVAQGGEYYDQECYFKGPNYAMCKMGFNECPEI